MDIAKIHPKAKKEIIATLIEQKRPDLVRHITDPGEARASLSGDRRTLDQFVEMAAESMEYPNPEDAQATPEVIQAVKQYEKALEAALSEWLKKHPLTGQDYVGLDHGDQLDALMDAEAEYLVLMTLRGEGVGIWDGDWDHFFADENREIKELQKFLEQKLGKFADDTGTGSVNEAFDNAAYETAGGEETEEASAKTALASGPYWAVEVGKGLKTWWSSVYHYIRAAWEGITFTKHVQGGSFHFAHMIGEIGGQEFTMSVVVEPVSSSALNVTAKIIDGPKKGAEGNLGKYPASAQAGLIADEVNKWLSATFRDMLQ